MVGYIALNDTVFGEILRTRSGEIGAHEAAR